MTVFLSSAARKRFRQIYNYYNHSGGQKYAKKIRARINNKILLLVNNPRLGQVEYQLEHLDQGHRYLVTDRPTVPNCNRIGDSSPIDISFTAIADF